MMQAAFISCIAVNIGCPLWAQTKNMNVKENVCSFENLYKAMRKCKRGVNWKESVQGYSKNGLVNVYKLRKSLLDDTYKIDKYTAFKVFEPKERNILSTRFKDRVFQRSLCDNYLYDMITKSFIYDNCACQKGKGTEFARKRLTHHLHRYYRKYGSEGYVLKIDIKNYFGSTLHTVAKNAVKKRIPDKWALQKVYDVIDSYGDEVGMGLGSELTQLIQLAVLDDLDHFVKEKLKIKHYIRYMDDAILMHNSKSYLKNCLKAVESELYNIGLSLNRKKTQIMPLKQGISFLGFKYRLSKSGKVIMAVLKSKLKRRKRRIKRLVKLWDKGRISLKKLNQCFESYLSYLRNTKNHAKRCCYKAIKKLCSFFEISKKGVIA